MEGEIGAINKSIKIKVSRTTMTMITPFKALCSCMYVLSLVKVSYSRQGTKLFPLQSRSSIRGVFPVLLPSYRRDNTTFGHIFDTVSIILRLLPGRETPLTPQWRIHWGVSSPGQIPSSLSASLSVILPLPWLIATYVNSFHETVWPQPGISH